jgi:hypothetical protein
MNYFMLKNWAIYRCEGGGKLRCLGVISATGQEDAMSDPEALCGRLWSGQQA